jgi:molybdopterin molybdotransferase
MDSAGLLDLDSALATVLDAAAAATLPAEPLSVGLGALGRVLCVDVVAQGPVPAFDGSAMDGFAVRSADLDGAGAADPVVLAVIDESRAGAPSNRHLGAGEAIAISTGAVIPRGADAVIPIEDTIEDTAGDRGEVRCLAPAAAGAWIRRAGEDIRSGSTVLPRGTRLGPAELGVLASLGRGEIACARSPSVAVLVTGDELVGPEEQARAGGVRDSNSLTIPALARLAGGDIIRVGRLPDDPEATRTGIATAVEQADMTVICGGVSVGTHDHVRPALDALGASRRFWGIALKPGRPTWFGTQGTKLIFGLPGNPVSAMVTFTLLAAPALATMLGIPRANRRTTAMLDADYPKRPGRAHAVRCQLRARDDGLHALPTGAQGSHILTSMLGAEALAMIPAGSADVQTGERVVVEPLLPPSLLGFG